MKNKVILSIGGSDPSGGAGIQADLKAFSLLNLHGSTVLTSVTAQNTQRVISVHPLSVSCVEDQISSIMEDYDITFVKTGLIPNETIFDLIVNKVKIYDWNLIVDPVLSATTGNDLSFNSISARYKKDLFKYALCITPNLLEAEVLVDKSLRSLEDIENAAILLQEYGSKYVLIKGGHFQGDYATDVFFDGDDMHHFTLPRITGKKAHGSGCTLSAIITGLLALGRTPFQAIEQAKFMLWQMIASGYHPGKGVDILNSLPENRFNLPEPMSSLNHFFVWSELQQIIPQIMSNLLDDFIPEVGINIGFALENAKTHQDICAINGRIIKSSNVAKKCGNCIFGGSSHVASIILAVMRVYPDLRCAMNIVFSEENLKICEKSGLRMSTFNREDQPDHISSTMDWGTTAAIMKGDKAPDLIYDRGAVGKEPMIRIIGLNPQDVFRKLCLIRETSS